MSLYESIAKNGEPTDHDLATLSDWCDEQEKFLPDNDWKKTIAGLRKASDALLRRRARSRVYLSGETSTSVGYESKGGELMGGITGAVRAGQMEPLIAKQPQP